MIRAFIAVEVPDFPAIRDFISELKKTPARLKAVEPENLHITLKFLGDIAEEKAAELGDALKSIDANSFSFELESAGAFPGAKNPKVIWAGVKEDGSLSSLQRGVEEICASLGFEREKREFSPHLTVGRVKDRNTKGIRPVVERYSEVYFGTVDVKEVKLKKSFLTPQGPIYSDMASVPLRHP